MLDSHERLVHHLFMLKTTNTAYLAAPVTVSAEAPHKFFCVSAFVWTRFAERALENLKKD